MEKLSITENELKIIYEFLSLEFDDMSPETQKIWTEILIEIENNLEKDEKDNGIRT